MKPAHCVGSREFVVRRRARSAAPPLSDRLETPETTQPGTATIFREMDERGTYLQKHHEHGGGRCSAGNCPHAADSESVDAILETTGTSGPRMLARDSAPRVAGELTGTVELVSPDRGPFRLRREQPGPRDACRPASLGRRNCRVSCRVSFLAWPSVTPIASA